MGSFLSAVNHNDLSILFILIAVACLVGAAYVGGWMRNIPGALVLVFVAVVALIFGT